MSTGDELQASLAARRDLGPDFEDEIVASFLDKMDQEIDRRVDERLRASPARRGPTDGQRLALAIVSLSLGTVATVVLALTQTLNPAFIAIWAGIIVVNLAYNRPRA